MGRPPGGEREASPWLIPAVFAEATVARGAPLAGTTSKVRFVGLRSSQSRVRGPHDLSGGAGNGKVALSGHLLVRDDASAGFEQVPEVFPFVIVHEVVRGTRRFRHFHHGPVDGSATAVRQDVRKA